MAENAEIYSDFAMNEGLDSTQRERNMSLSKTPDCKNIEMLEAGGISSTKGYEEVAEISTASVTRLRGVGNFVATSYGKIYFMIALDDGIHTKIYAHDIVSNKTTELKNVDDSNRLTAGLNVDFAVIMDKVYFKCESETRIMEWDGNINNPAELFFAHAGIVPFNTYNLFSWQNRLGVAGTRSNRSEFFLSAYRDVYHWDSAVGNSLGDVAYGNIPDSDTDQNIVTVIPNAFGTLLILRERSIFVMIGESPGDWITQPITVNEGCIAKHTALMGNNVAYYLSNNGLKQLKGKQESQEANRYDSLNTTSLTDGIKDKLKEYSPEELSNAHAIMYNDTYRLNINGDVYVFDLKANGLQGALTDASIEGNIGRYLVYNGDLYGVGKEDGKLYKLLTGETANGSDYVKSYTTRLLDMGDARDLKNFTGLRVFGHVDGDYNIKCDIFIDGHKSADYSLDLDFEDVTNKAAYIVSEGTSTSVGAGYLEDTSQSWTVNELSGLYLGTSNLNTYQIISNTSNRITIDGTPVSGSYAIAPDSEMFYTGTSDEDETWASAYSTVVKREASGNRRIDLRGKTIKLKFYNENKDEPFTIDGFQIKYELLRHNSLATREE